MKLSITATALILLSSTIVLGQTKSQSVNAFESKSGSTIVIDKATNSISHIRFSTGRSFAISGNQNDEKALNFISENKELFDQKAGSDSYAVKDKTKDISGGEHLSLQQFYKGVPVWDGQLKFHFDRQMNLKAMNGNVIPVNNINTSPSISAEQAAEMAKKVIIGELLSLEEEQLQITKNELFIFQTGLAQGYQGPVHLVFSVEVFDGAGIREEILIDAHTGRLVERFNLIHSNIERKLYQPTYTPSSPQTNLIWKEGDPVPQSFSIWQKSEIETSSHVYNFMKSTFGRVSYNNQDAVMITTHNNPTVSCPNASWNGVSANYCDQTASDDVVAHEWAHAYTEYTSGLVYSYQSGALNEAYSDIWGETIDQLNGYMDENESTASRTGCSGSDRWLLGEKASAWTSALRDMYNPNCKGDPGRVTDPLYQCTATDNGGVHTNSGVINHTYSLLVDGGEYNGQNINGIGLTKAAHIFWRAQVFYMNRTTDFASFADILETAALDLIGTPLSGLTLSNAPVSSNDIISQADYNELVKVIAAVELRVENNCRFTALFKPTEAICVGGNPENAIFYEDFESGMNGWELSHSTNSGSWTNRDWEVKTNAPQGRGGHVAYGKSVSSGDCQTNFQNGTISISSPIINIPGNVSGPYKLAFDHLISLEQNWDGGNIKYKINGGAWTTVPTNAFIINGYNSTLFTIAQGSDNPLSGQTAFSGGDQGSLSSAWGQSQIDLSVIGVASGQNIQFRWDLGTNGCGSWDGWYIDDIRVYSCSKPTLQFAEGSSFILESAAATATPGSECLKYVEKVTVFKINAAPSAPVQVNIVRLSGNATSGNGEDIVISPMQFTLQAGKLTQNISIKVSNDAYVEGDETIVLGYNFTNSGNAQPESFLQEHTVLIKDNDFEPDVFYSEPVNTNFETGLPAGWTIQDPGPYPQTWASFKTTVNIDPSGTRFMFANSDAFGELPFDKSLETAAFNTLGMKTITLTFLEYFRAFKGINDYDEQAFVDVWDGLAWRTILLQNETTGTSGNWGAPVARTLNIPLEYANAAMKIRFRFLAKHDYWWAIDNVKVKGEFQRQIESETTASPSVNYLGPNATVYYYNEANNKIMAKVKNNSSHNYGCTGVSISHVEPGSAGMPGGHAMVTKTFSITPQFPSSNQEYEISLFYNPSDFSNLDPGEIQSMVKLDMSTMPGIVTNGELKPVNVTNVYDNGLAFTSSFQSGFSGFSISDADPNAGPLPVKLINFKGYQTGEGVQLEWSTSEEINSDYFEIEKSDNAKNFFPIGIVNANKNTSEISKYHYFDLGKRYNKTYYRLKEVDMDGTYQYSKMIVTASEAQQAPLAYPNPVLDVVNFITVEKDEENVKMNIVNQNGQKVNSPSNVSIIHGKATHNLSDLPSGIYHITLTTSYKNIQYKVVKE